jgi:hypothetical protein
MRTEDQIETIELDSTKKNSKEAVIEIDNLCKSFGDLVVLKNLSF